ncbi:NF-kappa-B inhibitor cactus, partial [Eumeta japonica]
MWNSTPTPSTISPSDNKQNIKEVVDVRDCKCSEAEQLDQPQNNSKRKTLTFGGQLSCSSNTLRNESLDKEAVGNKRISEFADETIDSGFISGPQTSLSANLDADNKAAGMSRSKIKKLNKTDQEITSNKLEEYKETQPPAVNIDSGIIEEEYDESSSKGLPMHLVTHPYQIETTTISKQITPANAWEKYYQQNDDGDTALHLACISGYEDVVIALIRMAPHPCLFNIQNDDAQTPLHLATLTAQPKIIRMLLIAGAKLYILPASLVKNNVFALTTPISASEVNEFHRQYGHRANDKSYLKCAKLPSDLEIRNYD